MGLKTARLRSTAACAMVDPFMPIENSDAAIGTDRSRDWIVLDANAIPCNENTSELWRC